MQNLPIYAVFLYSIYIFFSWLVMDTVNLINEMYIKTNYEGVCSTFDVKNMFNQVSTALIESVSKSEFNIKISNIC